MVVGRQEKNAIAVLEEPWSSEGQTCRVRKARPEARWSCRPACQGGIWSLPACDINRAKCWARRRLFQAEDKEYGRVRSQCFVGGTGCCKKSGRKGAVAAQREEANGWEVRGVKYLVCLVKEFGFYSGGRGQMATEDVTTLSAYTCMSARCNSFQSVTIRLILFSVRIYVCVCIVFPLPD